MSENLDLVRSLYADWERGDFSHVEWADPEIEFVITDGPEPTRVFGAASMARAWSEFPGAWEDLRAEAEEYRELDGERVLVLIHHRGRGKTSGLELGQIQFLQEIGIEDFHTFKCAARSRKPGERPRINRLGVMEPRVAAEDLVR